MEMRYFWLLYNDAQKYVSYHYYPGRENLRDMYMKAFNGIDTKKDMHLYIHKKKSPQKLVRALTPSLRQGCVGNRQAPT